MKRAYSLLSASVVMSLGVGIFFSSPSSAQESANNIGAYADFDLDSTRYAPPHQATADSGNAPNASNQYVATAMTSNSTVARPPQKVQSTKSSNQRVARLPRAGWLPLDRVFGGYMPLPPTLTDSFVRSSAGMADQIYGDEGTTDIPPFFGFDEQHRIERGIYTPGLTTGHRSLLPEAWGYPN